MGRTKNFDPERALDAALDLFWVKGYAATSVEDLVQGLDINRGSLYSTFGSKDELYTRALERYVDHGVAYMSAALAPGGDNAATMRGRLERLLADTAISVDARGCLIVGASSERCAVDEGTREFLTAGLGRIRGAILAEIATADTAGGPGNALAPGLTPERAVDLVLVAMQGLRVLSTVGDTGADIPGVNASLLATLYG